MMEPKLREVQRNKKKGSEKRGLYLQMLHYTDYL